MKIRKKIKNKIILKSYIQLEQEYKKAVVELQKVCKHNNITDWCDYWWAIGHSTGRKVKVCKHCRKIVEYDDSALHHMREQTLNNNKMWSTVMTEKEKQKYIKTGKWPKGISQRERSEKNGKRANNSKKLLKEI